MTPSGIEPVIFRFVAQHCATAVGLASKLIICFSSDVLVKIIVLSRSTACPVHVNTAQNGHRYPAVRATVIAEGIRRHTNPLQRYFLMKLMGQTYEVWRML